MSRIDEQLFIIEKFAGAIQLDADNKEQSLSWEKVHEWARDVVIASLEIRKILGLAAAHDRLIELTMLLDEHPEKWDGPCWCQSCIEDGPGTPSSK